MVMTVENADNRVKGEVKMEGGRRRVWLHGTGARPKGRGIRGRKKCELKVATATAGHITQDPCTIHAIQSSLRCQHGDDTRILETHLLPLMLDDKTR